MPEVLKTDQFIGECCLCQGAIELGDFYCVLQDGRICHDYCFDTLPENGG